MATEIRDLLVVLILCLYSGKRIQGVLYMAFFTVWSYALLNFLTLDQLQLAQGCTILLFITARLQQVWTNIVNQSVGQLSIITVFMQFAGSIARVFTTLKEVDDNMLLTSFVVSSTLNGIIFLQFFYYGSKKGVAKKFDGDDSAPKSGDDTSDGSGQKSGRTKPVKRRPRRE